MLLGDPTADSEYVSDIEEVNVQMEGVERGYEIHGSGGCTIVETISGDARAAAGTL